MNCPTTVSTSTLSRRGFTIIEALVAGVILTLSAVALGATVSHCMRSLTLARDYQRAAELLDETFTKIDIIGPARLYYEGPTEGIFKEPHQRFTWQATIDTRAEGSLYEVTVRISWQNPGGGSRHVEAQTLLNDPAGSRPGELLWEDL